MAFADDLAVLNEFHFFREFTFSRTTFRPAPTLEVELADSIIWLADLLVIFQLKERETANDTTAEAEKRWFERKVMRQATRQVRDTLAYLENTDAIEIRNHRGHAFDLAFGTIRQLHKLVVYRPHDVLPEESRRVKYHRSRTAGLIHVLGAKDYLGIVRTLLTPAEVAEYLAFRETLIDNWQTEVVRIPEEALVGQYLNGNINARPSMDFVEYLRQLDHRTAEWDMSGVITAFPERMTTANASTDYYPIVREIARLKRNELREFRTRFLLSMEKTRANEFVLPYRMACPRTGCGFVFVPLAQDFLTRRRNALQNFTVLHKHEQRLARCIGASVAPEKDGWFSVEWCYLDFPWVMDPQLDEMLRSNNPFREVKTAELNRYTYKTQQPRSNPPSPPTPKGRRG